MEGTELNLLVSSTKLIVGCLGISNSRNLSSIFLFSVRKASKNSFAQKRILFQFESLGKGT